MLHSVLQLKYIFNDNIKIEKKILNKKISNSFKL